MTAAAHARLERYRPIPHDNPTKRRALELFAEFFCLRTNDAAMLLRNRRHHPERCALSPPHVIHPASGRISLPRTVSRCQPVSEAASRYVYGLSAKGVDHALQNGYSTLATKTLDEHSIRTLDHELEITSFHVALRGLCAAQGLRYAWRQTNLKHTVHPDALFYVVDPAQPDKAFCYFLEIERAKLGNYRNGEPQIFRKLKKYYEYFNSTVAKRNGDSASTAWWWSSEVTPGARDSSRPCGRSAATACSGSPQERHIARAWTARSSRRRKMTHRYFSPSLSALVPSRTIQPIARKSGIIRPVSRRLRGLILPSMAAGTPDL
jgi:hypothetical protein